MMKAMFTPATKGEVFNPGNPEVYETGRGGRPEDIARRRPAIGKAQRVLGWSPTVGLDEGLARTIPWFREVLATGA